MPSNTTDSTTGPIHSELSFEEALSGLQDVVSRLESGELTLDETITTFRQGSELATRCQRMIADAELRITELVNEPDQELSGNRPVAGTLF